MEGHSRRQGQGRGCGGGGRVKSKSQQQRGGASALGALVPGSSLTCSLLTGLSSPSSFICLCRASSRKAVSRQVKAAPAQGRTGGWAERLPLPRRTRSPRPARHYRKSPW